MTRRYWVLFVGSVFLAVGASGCDEKGGNVACESGGDCDDGLICVQNNCVGLDDLDQDFDGDGLSNEREGALGTDPRLIDTDGDGEDDRSEIGNGDEPIDSDGDGIIDALERDDVDSDGDGVPDEQDPCNADPTCPTAPEELCNGVDDDGDGTVDEGFTLGAPCTVSAGVCARPGSTVCDESGRATRCDAEPGLAGQELCNGLDDDCDGRIDEGVTNACGVCGELPPELCDGIDNDCDPATPDGSAEDWFDAACDGEDADRCAEGAFVCAGGLRVCDDDTEDALDVCNGVDDDCDPTTPDGAADGWLGAACDGPDGDLCAEGVELCAAGVRTCTDDTADGLEACDGQDNDCDPDTEDGADEPWLGARCDGDDADRCEEGILTCDGGQQRCTDTTGDAVELCDGQDNDCDPSTADGSAEPWFEDACDGADVDACADGRDRCVAGARRCDDDAEAVVELCNDLDDDCNGTIDDPFAELGQGCSEGLGACAAVGHVVCADDGRGTRCDAVAGQPSEEVCNGIDDDCDGSVDEADPQGGGACATGRPGVCGAGTEVCTEGRLTCRADVAPGDEACNGLDDDCDGQVDEIFRVALPCSVGDGACAAQGLTRCNAAGDDVACRATPNQPVAEVCNGVDDDCDGVVDNQPSDAGGDCSVGDGACLAHGTERCIAGALRCDAAPGQPVDESCNGVDDDCDGVVDDDPAEVGLACVGGLGACAAVGAIACADGLPRCDAVEGVPDTEQCNGRDDDCDGQVDEDAADVGSPCFEGLGACAAAGALRCVAGALACDARIGGGGPEVCNGVDDDCNGLVDDAPGDAGGDCAAGVGACAASGVEICVGGALTCGAQAGVPGVEICNGLDDDCDGAVDDAATDAGAACLAGVGACTARGAMRCQDGALACDAVAGDPTPETCNGQDDDCDGVSDNAPATQARRARRAWACANETA